MQNESPNDEKPLVVLQSETGIRFGLDPELFERWKRGIPQEDQEGFIFYGGDIGLARFVCAFDYLTNRKRTPHPQAVVQAYAAAFDLDPSSYTCRVRAYEAFDHAAVQFLLEQFATAGLRDARESAQPKYAKLLDKVLTEATADDVSLSGRIKALDAGTKFMKMMQADVATRRPRPPSNPRAIVRKATIDAIPGTVDLARSAPEEEPDPE